MPIYEFSCPNCGHIFEDLVTFSCVCLLCPRCQTESEKIISLSSFHLKGEGWSKDGYTKPKITENDTIIKMPEYTDRNSGKKWLGKPEVGTVNNED